MYVQGVPIVTFMLAIRKCQHWTFTVTTDCDIYVSHSKMSTLDIYCNKYCMYAFVFSTLNMFRYV